MNENLKYGYYIFADADGGLLVEESTGHAEVVTDSDVVHLAYTEGVRFLGYRPWRKLAAEYPRAFEAAERERPGSWPGLK